MTIKSFGQCVVGRAWLREQSKQIFDKCELRRTSIGGACFNVELHHGHGYLPELQATNTILHCVFIQCSIHSHSSKVAEDFMFIGSPLHLHASQMTEGTEGTDAR